MTVVPSPDQLQWAFHPGVDAPHPTSTGSAHALPMTAEEKEAAARERHPVGFAPPAPRKLRRRKA